jgi:hypothetical protein
MLPGRSFGDDPATPLRPAIPVRRYAPVDAGNRAPNAILVSLVVRVPEELGIQK